jgi:DnaJ like chaperone protein
MSIWRRIVDGAQALGGPLGALARALDPEAPPRDGTKQIAFTIGVIALSAKMAKADGEVSAQEVAAFRDVFQAPPEEVANVARVFDLARQDVAGYEAYARQIARLFATDRQVLEDLMHGLFHIAEADGPIGEAELEYLRRVAQIFGFGRQGFQRIRSHHLDDLACDPYIVLGLPCGAPFDEVKAAWRRLVREHHPDRVTSQGLPQEFVQLANHKMAKLNEAYERIRRDAELYGQEA